MASKNQKMTNQTKTTKSMKRGKSSKAGRQDGQGRRESAPVAMGSVQRNIRTANISGNDKMMRVMHREYIADVVGTPDFTVSQYAINPGQTATFPWLSIVASNFEKYRFRKLKFCYESSVATTQAGTVMTAFDLDASDPAPLTKAQMMSYLSAQRSNVWMKHESTQPMAQTQLYVRVAGLPANTDIKTYDAGNLFIATQGNTATGAVGELYVEYDVELFVPQLTPSYTGVALNVDLTAATTGGIGGAYTLGGVSGTLPVANLKNSVNTLPVQAEVGQRFLVTTEGQVSTGTATVPALVITAVNGSSGTIVDSSTVVNGTSALASYVVQCSTTTNGTSSYGSGYLVLTFNNVSTTLPANTTKRSINVAQWQESIPFL